MKNIIKMSPIALGCFALVSAEILTVSSANAAPIKVTQTDKGTVAVMVAAGKTLTYTLDGQTVSFAGGSSLVIPAGATNIFFPVGSVVTIKRAAVGKPFTYTVVKNVTLAGLTKPEFRRTSTSFVYNRVPGVKSEGGSKIETVFVNPTSIGSDKNNS